MNQDDVIDIFFNIKQGDKVILKNKKYFLNDNFFVTIKDPIEVNLPFKTLGFETKESFHSQNHFICGFDCFHLVSLLP